ncbi:MAG: rRNA pseudouridine synthase [Clostridia bacterium]|nr:rRNA pseudouridine synthase [Clostridia bacterium]
MEPIRIQKYISDSGIMSRRAAEEEIRRGRVTVNSEPATIGMKIDPSKDTVKIGNKLIKPRGNKKYSYIMLNKPRGFVTTMSDEKGRACVAELVSDLGNRVYPVGRLDYDSEGLLFFTDDGALANKLMHPKGHIPKVYHVKTPVEVDNDTVKRLNKPFEIDGYTTAPAECTVVSMKKGSTVLRIVLNEGRNRQIRKMFESLELEIEYLKRVAIGDIKLGNLKAGEWRRLTPAQVSYLKKYNNNEK